MAIKTYNDQNFVAIANAIRSKNGETTQYKPSEMAAAISAIESALEVLPQDTVSGALANFPDGSNNYPVVELIANIAPKQAGSGDPAPDNVRPISGYTGMKVTKTGSNLLSLGNVDFTYKGLRYYTQNNALYIDGTSVGETSSNDTIFKDNLYFYLPSGTYYFTRNNYPQAMYLRAEVNGVDTSLVTNAGSFTLTSLTKCWVAFYQYNRVYDNLLIDSYVSVGSAATAYEPYLTPEVKSISWESEAGTVYGGSLNVTTGVLTVDRGMLDMDNVSFSSVTLGGYPVWLYTGLENPFLPLNSDPFVGTSEKYTPIRYNGISNNTNKIAIKNDGYLYVNTGDNVTVPSGKLVYKLATPETYQLTPEEVKTLLGVNNIYNDTNGDTEVTYRADIDLYIAKKIGE